jgi:hypothetical protein
MAESSLFAKSLSPGCRIAEKGRRGTISQTAPGAFNQPISSSSDPAPATLYGSPAGSVLPHIPDEGRNRMW